MKKLIFPAIAALIFIISSCGEGYVDPQAYYDDLNAQYIKVRNAQDSLDILLNETEMDLTAIDGAFEDAVIACDNAIKAANDMGGYQGDEAMKNAAVDLFNEVKNVVNTDYKELYELYKKPIDQWEDADIDLMYELFESIDDKIYDKDDAFYDAQLDYSTNYSVEMF
ncbi:MAG: hypothetical protein JXR68_09930 [Bacteroidales bacterium]|nr:hypothetical protein [Bacteroidales bacterium]